jgi:hypothetical protein
MITKYLQLHNYGAEDTVNTPVGEPIVFLRAGIPSVKFADGSEISVVSMLMSDTTLTYASSITTDASTVSLNARIEMPLDSGDLTLNAPTNPQSRQRISYWLTASGAERTVTLDTAIKTLTGGTFTGAIASGSIRLITLAYCGSAWVVVENQQFAL